MILRSFFGIFIGYFLIISSAQSASVLLIQERQKERFDQRWTLTDWLHTKERMKMMDLWLALVSDPQKAKFVPEINFAYGIPLYDSKLTEGATTYFFTQKTDPLSKNYEVSSNIYLTNIISGLVGIRTLNIDLGVHGFYQKLERDEISVGPLLRIFGSSAQDSSLDLGFIYTRRDTLIPSTFGAGSPSNGAATDWSARFQGWYYRASLNLYLLKFLGAEGIFKYYNKIAEASLTSRLWNGYSYSLSGFIEISLIRLSYGYFKETSAYTIDTAKIADSREGFFAKAALFF